MSLMPAQEASTPIPGTQVPEDAAPADLTSLLDQADKLIWRDGGMDQEEKRVFLSWVQMQAMKMQAMSQGTRPSSGPMGAPPPGLAPPGISNDEMDFGATDGMARPEGLMR